jgi:hypothetical protein
MLLAMSAAGLCHGQGETQTFFLFPDLVTLVTLLVLGRSWPEPCTPATTAAMAAISCSVRSVAASPRVARKAAPAGEGLGVWNLGQ